MESDKLKLLAAYQLDTVSRIAVVMYQLYGRGPVDVEEFAKVYYESPLFKYDGGYYECGDCTLCRYAGKAVELAFAKVELLKDYYLRDYVVGKIEGLLRRGVPVTRDLAEIARYQLRESDAVALLAFTMFGPGAVDVQRLEEEAVQKLGLSRSATRLEIKFITEKWLGKYYLKKHYLEGTVLIRRRVDELVHPSEGKAAQKRGLIERLLHREQPQLDRKLELAVAIYKKYGTSIFDPEELYRDVIDLYGGNKAEFYLDLLEVTAGVLDMRYLRYEYVKTVKQYLREEEKRRKRIRLARLFS